MTFRFSGTGIQQDGDDNPTEQQVRAHLEDIRRRQREKISNEVFLQFLRKQAAEKESFRTLPFTCCLWVTFLLVTMLHSSLESAYVTRFGVMQDLERISVLRSANETESPLTIGTLESREDVMKWLEYGITDRIKGGILKTYNKIIGPVVVSQSRAMAEECAVFESCHDIVLGNTQEDCGIKKLYGDKCYPVTKLDTEAFSPGKSAIDVDVLLPTTDKPRREHQKSIDDRSYVAGYATNIKKSDTSEIGHRYYVFLNSFSEFNPAKVSVLNTAAGDEIEKLQRERLGRLRRQRWLSANTIDLRAEFVTLNPETNVFLLVKITIYYDMIMMKSISDLHMLHMITYEIIIL